MLEVVSYETKTETLVRDAMFFTLSACNGKNMCLLVSIKSRSCKELFLCCFGAVSGLHPPSMVVMGGMLQHGEGFGVKGG